MSGAVALASSAALVPFAVANEPAATFVENPCGIVRLPCGRRLAYAEYGDPNGRQVVLYVHGYSSCRLEGEIFLDALRAKPGVRVFALDRPGIGQSDPDPNLGFLTWPADVEVFANALRIDRFAQIAVSGGVPYALATARAFPNRMTSMVLASTVAPLDAVGTRRIGSMRGAVFADRHPVVTTIALRRSATATVRHPNRVPGAILLGPADRAQLKNPDAQRLLARVTAEAFRQGAGEIARAAGMLAQPWSCWLKDVQTNVSIYQGCEDRVTPPHMASCLAALLPNAQLRFIPGEGHLSLCWNYAAELLAIACEDR